MSLVIEEKKVLDDWEVLMREYLQDIRGVKDKEQLESILTQFRTNLQEEERIAFCGYLDGAPCGFISGSARGEIIEAISLYVLPKSYYQNTASELVKTLTAKAFETGFQHFRLQMRLPFNKEPNFEEILKKDGYLIFQRASMNLEVKDVLDYSYTLPEGYTFEPFSINKVDEIMQVLVDANPIGHTDTHIYPEMRSAEITKQVFGGATENFTKLDPAINPQIIFESKIVGISQVFTSQKDVAFIGEMCIHPDHQRKGLGKALMKNIILESSRRDIKRIRLAVTVSNVGAYKLYEKTGFKKASDNIAVIKHKYPYL